MEVNSCDKIEARLGGKEQIKSSEVFNIVIANINRNILLDDMHAYAAAMQKDSILLLSGFYALDATILSEKASEFGLERILRKEEKSWTVLGFRMN